MGTFLFTHGLFGTFLTGIKPPKDKSERKQWRATVKAQAKIESALGFGKAPKPAKFPMKFQEFLRRTFGGRLHSERLRMFRKYLVSEFFSSLESPDDFAAKLIGAMGENGVKDQESYFHLVREIKQWKENNRIQQRINAAKSRWSKEKSKKPVDAGQPPQK